MTTSYQTENQIKGRLLARGKGLESMLRICWDKKFNRKNTILEVEEPSDIDSKWAIYANVGE